MTSYPDKKVDEHNEGLLMNPILSLHPICQRALSQKFAKMRDFVSTIRCIL